MKRLNVAVWLALATAAPLATTTAQDEAATQVSPAAQARFDALSDEFMEARTAWSNQLREKMTKAEEAGEELAASELESPVGDSLPKFHAAATEYAGTEDAVPFLVWIVDDGAQADIELARTSFETICSEHASSPNLEPLLGVLPYIGQMLGDVNDSLAQLAEKSSLVEMRDWAAFALYSGILESADASSNEFDEALGGLIAALASTEDRRLKKSIERKILIAESFGTGMVAPDIVGLDLDGTAFKLSDYQGKVVFLDFWGDW